MTSKSKQDCHMAILFLLLVVFHCSTAFRFSNSKLKDALAVGEKASNLANAELAALVRPMPEDPSGTFTHALELLASLQASPSCHRIAASTLLDSCHSIEGSENDADASIEDFRSIYAAQLAMCEIGSANSVKPQSCDLLAIATKSKSKGVRNIRKDKLSQCLQSLESRPQWWTSYSNNKQNAGVMCRAARIDIEKDQLIKLHKSMVEISADASSALARATNDANAALIHLQSDFALAQKKFQQQLLDDLEASTDKAQSFLERLVNSMDAALQTAMGRVVSATKELELVTASLGKNVLKANADSVNLQKNVGKVFQQVVEGSAELAATQTQQWYQSRELAAQVQGSLQGIRDAEVDALLGAVYGIHQELQASNELVSSLYLKQSALDERLFILDESFDGLASKAETFQAAQTRQAETQTRLHEQMQIEIQTTRGFLDDVTFSAANLKIAVDSTASIMAKLTFLTGIAKWISWVGWTVSALLALRLVSPRHARYAAATIAFLLCAYFSGAAHALSSISSNAKVFYSNLVREVDILLIFKAITAALLFMFFVVTITNNFSNWMRARRSNKPSIATDLPIMEKVFSKRTHHSHPI